MSIAYMFAVRRWLHAGPQAPARTVARPGLQDWITKYGLEDRELRLRVPETSRLVGRTVESPDLRSAYGVDVLAIDRPQHTLTLIVGMMPFSLALQRTGGIELAARGLTMITGAVGSYGLLAALFGVTAMLGLFVSNTATAVLMAPVALAVAKKLGASPYPFAMVVAIAASAAYMTPVSSPVNTLVVEPGEYTLIDFVRVGVPLAVIVLVITVLLVPWFFPF